MESRSNYDHLINNIKSNIKLPTEQELGINVPREIPGENILNDTLLDININSQNMPELPTFKKEGECPFSHRMGKVSSCPFMNGQSNEPKNSKFEFHYEIPMEETTRDFVFNRLNYSKENYEKAKWIREMPNYLRNTWFINNDKINLIRQKDYSSVFIITEEMKEKAHKLYEEKKYQKAIGAYTLIYSIFRWLKWKDPDKKGSVLKYMDFSKDNSIIDEDIEIERIKTDPQYKFEEESYKTCLIYWWKSWSYCYLNLRNYTEAKKCMDEAVEYAISSKPDVLFRRAQAIMYNKFSSLTAWESAKADLQEAKALKPNKLIDDHWTELEKLITEKKYRDVANVKRLLESVNYAYNKITTKKLNVHDHIYYSYTDIHFNYKLIHEMKDTYYSSIKFFQETKNEKQLELTVKNIEKFFDFYYPYKFYYNLTISNVLTNYSESLSEEEKETAQWIRTNETGKLLFNDFKLKKCDELYGNMDWDMTIWKYCFDTVNAEEKKIKEEKKKREKQENGLEKFKIWNRLGLTNKHYIIFSIVLFTMSLLFIGYHVMYYHKHSKDI